MRPTLAAEELKQNLTFYQADRIPEYHKAGTAFTERMDANTRNQ